VTGDILWLVGRYAFLGLLYLFVLLVLRALVAEMHVEAPAASPLRHTMVMPRAADAGHTGELAPAAAAEHAVAEPAPEPRPIAAPVSLPPRLTVVESADPAELPTGTTFTLTAVTTIGRGTHNSIALPSDKYASTNHALVFVRDGALYVRDRGSTNGTLLNGTRADGEILLHDGDRLAVGTTVLRYSAGRAPEAPGPAETAGV
jgi:hypothetical protein